MDDISRLTRATTKLMEVVKRDRTSLGATQIWLFLLTLFVLWRSC